MKYTITRGTLKIPLASEECYAIYLKIDENYRREDAVRHVLERFGEDFFLRSDAEDFVSEVVGRFYDQQDCNIPENDTWDEAVEYVNWMHSPENTNK